MRKVMNKVLSCVMAVLMLVSVCGGFTMGVNAASAITCVSTAGEEDGTTVLTFSGEDTEGMIWFIFPAEQGTLEELYNSFMEYYPEQTLSAFTQLFLIEQLRAAQIPNEPVVLDLNSSDMGTEMLIYVGPAEPEDISDYYIACDYIETTNLHIPYVTLPTLMNGAPVQTQLETKSNPYKLVMAYFEEDEQGVASETETTMLEEGKSYTIVVEVVMKDERYAITEDTRILLNNEYLNDERYTFDPETLTYTVKGTSGIMTSDAHGVMAYGYTRNGGFDIKGLFGGEWKKVTYGNAGFTSVIDVGTIEYDVPATPEMTALEGTGLETKIYGTFTNGGKVICITYEIKNVTEDDIVFSLASGADVQIGYDDSATISPFEDGTGFYMQSSREQDKNEAGEYAQFNFFGGEAHGVTPVDGFWYGRYGERYDNYFVDLENKEVLRDVDSGCTWHWADETVEAGETVTYTVKVGIGGEGSEDAASSPGELTNNTNPEENSCGTNLNEEAEELIETIPFSEEELALIAEGEDVAIYLEAIAVEVPVEEEHKDLVEEEMGEDAELGMYLDISLYKKVGVNEPVKVPNTLGAVTITLRVPDALINEIEDVTRTYAIVRVHEAGTETEVDTIECVYDPETKTITFETDAFSTYALVYTDAEIGTTPIPPVQSPDTGDATNMAAWVVFMLSAIGVVALGKKKF